MCKKRMNGFDGKPWCYFKEWKRGRSAITPGRRMSTIQQTKDSWGLGSVGGTNKSGEFVTKDKQKKTAFTALFLCASKKLSSSLKV